MIDDIATQFSISTLKSETGEELRGPALVQEIMKIGKQRGLMRDDRQIRILKVNTLTAIGLLIDLSTQSPNQEFIHAVVRHGVDYLDMPDRMPVFGMYLVREDAIPDGDVRLISRKAREDQMGDYGAVELFCHKHMLQEFLAQRCSKAAEYLNHPVSVFEIGIPALGRLANCGHPKDGVTAEDVQKVADSLPRHVTLKLVEHDRCAWK